MNSNNMSLNEKLYRRMEDTFFREGLNSNLAIAILKFYKNMLVINPCDNLLIRREYAKNHFIIRYGEEQAVFYHFTSAIFSESNNDISLDVCPAFITFLKTYQDVFNNHNSLLFNKFKNGRLVNLTGDDYDAIERIYTFIYYTLNNEFSEFTRQCILDRLPVGEKYTIEMICKLFDDFHIDVKNTMHYTWNRFKYNRNIDPYDLFNLSNRENNNETLKEIAEKNYDFIFSDEAIIGWSNCLKINETDACLLDLIQKYKSFRKSLNMSDDSNARTLKK